MSKKGKKEINAKGASRRKFLGKAGVATAAVAAASAGLPTLKADDRSHFEDVVREIRTSAERRTRRSDSLGSAPDDGNAVNPQQRKIQGFRLHLDQAINHIRTKLPPQNPGGDMGYLDNAGQFTKCLLHDNFGRVDATGFASYINAVTTGTQKAFEGIILGPGGRTLNGPQGGLRYQSDGCDPSALAVPAAPALASPEFAAEQIELYWASLLRDVNFNDYATNTTAIAAAAELDANPFYNGPRNSSGHVTTNELFRGGFGRTPNYFPQGNSNFFLGDLLGPYVSQLAILPTFFGALPLNQMWKVFLPASGGGADYMTDAPASGFAGSNWLNVQNGFKPSALPPLNFDPVNRFARNGRDWNSYTHVDQLNEAYLIALYGLCGLGVPANPGSPYASEIADNGFDTFGGPDIIDFVGRVAARALDMVWYQKWQVSRRVRPEVAGAFVHLANTGQGADTDVVLDPSLLNSQAVANSFSKYGTFLLSQPFPEGSPSHPDYPTGHGTVAGACITVLKFFFDGTFVIPNPQMVSEDGLSLLPVPSTCPPLTVCGELNKLAHNVSFAHGIHAGIHYRSSTDQSILLGEAFAISVLQDVAQSYNERFTVSFQKFDGTTQTISNNGGNPSEIG